MKITKSEAVAIVVVILSFVAGLVVYPYLPASVASHWNAAGEINGYMPKFWGVYLMPIVAAAMLLLLIVIPRIDPKKENIEKFRNQFDRFIILILLFLSYIYGLTLWWNLGGRFDMATYMVPAFGVLFYYAGVLISAAKMNYSIGIRTPWTLANEIVWQKTHVLGGKLFRAAGIIFLLGVFIPRAAIWLVLISVFAVTIWAVVYSYIEYRKQTQKK